MKLAKRRLLVLGVLILTATMLLCSVLTVSAIENCSHSYEVDRYTGLRACSICKEPCEHENWSSERCTVCKAVCMHDWIYDGATSTCRICGKTCSDHSNVGFDFDCAYCGKELNVSNFFNSGNQNVHDGNLILNDVHSVSFNFDFVVGTESTKLNVKDTSRSDNIYHNTTDYAGNKNDYFSLFTHVASGSYHVLASLWLDTAETKLYLTQAGKSTNKICEIKPGYEYNFDIVFPPFFGNYIIT